MYQLIKLRRGKATSFAPIINGRKKLPSDAGIPGTMNMKTMTAPWSVMMWLYFLPPGPVAVASASPSIWPVTRPVVSSIVVGVSSSRRTIIAADPPRKNMKSTANRYMIPIFLWSIVVAQFQTVPTNPPVGSR